VRAPGDPQTAGLRGWAPLPSTPLLPAAAAAAAAAALWCLAGTWWWGGGGQGLLLLLLLPSALRLGEAWLPVLLLPLPAPMAPQPSATGPWYVLRSTSCAPLSACSADSAWFTTRNPTTGPSLAPMLSSTAAAAGAAALGSCSGAALTPSSACLSTPGACWQPSGLYAGAS
jgi:hypothetical protein